MLRDLVSFMMERKKFWLAPVIIVLVLLGILVVASYGTAFSPFTYFFY